MSSVGMLQSISAKQKTSHLYPVERVGGLRMILFESSSDVHPS
jgi:hypothetical protein